MGADVTSDMRAQHFQPTKLPGWLASFVVAVSTWICVANASQAATLADTFGVAAKGSSKTVNHGPLDAILRAHLVAGKDGINRLDYPKLVGARHNELKSYIAALAQVDPVSLDRPEQLAYWINLYNAVTLDAVLARYPVKSIYEVSLKDASGQPADGPWKAKLVTVAGVSLSLDEIENGIVRPVFKDARAHYGLNCLSIGCPNLRPAALTGANIEAEFEQASKEFVNHPRALAFVDGKVKASSVFDWFVEDFGGFAGVIAHMQQYAEPALKEKLATVKAIDSYDYDWALADASQ
jgi:Protein of unknown function, DUF547